MRSFGTEDRETRCVVPAQPQIYDYILFRGSDIKDIRVLNTQPLNDPAIVQVSPYPLFSRVSEDSSNAQIFNVEIISKVV